MNSEEAKNIFLKPIKARPNFYASCFEILKELALNEGYNLIMHGSLNRDLDLVAIPWINDPTDELSFIQAMDVELTGNYKETKEEYMFSVLPGGRNSYVIDLHRLDKQRYIDQQYYLDISITPLVISDEQN